MGISVITINTQRSIILDGLGNKKCIPYSAFIPTNIRNPDIQFYGKKVCKLYAKLDVHQKMHL